MFIHLEPTKYDHHGFVWTIDKIANSVISKYLPDDIYMIRMKNGFDFKWVEFSGVANFQLGEWRDYLTIPPFKPDRVVSQVTYRKDEYNQYNKIDASPLHEMNSDSSDLRKRISSLTQSGIFVWWSGNTVFNKKGCQLIYIRHRNKSLAWYVSFWKGDKWDIFKSKGIAKSEIEAFLEE